MFSYTIHGYHSYSWGIIGQVWKTTDSFDALLLSVANIIQPQLLSLSSSMVDSNNQGILFSMVQLIASVTILASSVVFPSIWAAAVDNSPSTVLYIVQIFCC
jgi:hypothetical protein